MAPPTRAVSPLHHRGGPLALWLAVLALLAVLPFALQALDLGFYTTVATRALIFAIAATSLNLILGFGGLVAFGHAAFMGLGAYTVAVLADAGVTQAALAWPAAMAVSALAAAAIGAVSLRTRGVYFIMITLAFAQMFYYLVVSLPDYGGDDGMPLVARSGLPGVDLASDTALYFTVLVLAAATLWLVRTLVNAPLGWLLQASRENETRMAAAGGPVFVVRWQAFTLAGALAGLAGALLANLNGLVTPHMLHWSQSGQLMVMVILGGAGSLWGGVLGAAALLVTEELLSTWTAHWPLVLGAVLLAVVLFAPRGLAGLLQGRRGAGREGPR